MDWFFIALGAPFLWAIVNIVDKYLVDKYSDRNHGSGGLVLYSSLIGIFVAIGIAIFTDNIFSISLMDKILLLITGVLSIVWIILYLFTLEIEDVSSVAPWFLTVPIFGYILGYIFLRETLTTNQIIGSVIVLLGAFLISIDFMGEKKKIKIKPTLYMLSVSFIVAVVGLIFKYVTIEGNFWVSSFWEYAGLGLAGILIFCLVPQYRKDFIRMNKSGGKKIFSLNITSEFISVIGNFLTNFALLLAPITMVYLVDSFQPVVLLFLTIIGTKFFPKIISENLHHKILIPKIIAILIIIIGSILLFV